MATIICKNCNHHFKGNYCPECGQSAKVEKIGFSYFVHDIPHSVLHVDKGFFYTLRRLFINPGLALREYLAGKRVRHFRPFAFVLIMSTACTLLIRLIEKIINWQYMEDNPGKMIDSSRLFFARYPAILIFIMIPLLSLVTWLFFRKRGYNYWEHFLVNTYLAAYLNIFFLIIKISLLVKYYLTGSVQINYSIFMFLFMAYYGHAFVRLIADAKEKGRVAITMLPVNCLLATLYMTAFSITGIMVPWWG
jgi:hypothetical protein